MPSLTWESRTLLQAHAIDVLLKHLNADREDTLAFGDAKVDIPCWTIVDRSVMGGEEIKAMAAATDPVSQDGLYKAFEKLELI